MLFCFFNEVDAINSLSLAVYLLILFAISSFINKAQNTQFCLFFIKNNFLYLSLIIHAKG